MCDDWDDNAVVEVPSYGERRPIQSQTFGNSNFWGGNRDGGGWRDRGFDGNGDRNNRRDYQRNYDGFAGGSSNSSGGGRFNKNFGNNGGNKRFGRDNYKNGSDNEELLNVPSKYVGRIIGRGGSKINELQSESGAKIHVTKDTLGEETVVKLFGDPDAINKAKTLINELTTEINKLDHGNAIKLVDAKDLPPVEEKKPVNIDWKAFFEECIVAENAEWDKYPPIKKQFYVEHPEVTRMSEKEVEAFREENNNIVVDRTFKKENSAPIPKPCPKFYHAFHNYPEILDEIAKAGFENPRPFRLRRGPYY
ncbi:hypothetical protein NQ318_005302 [Aromia moschata]|uniref:K Homology domain-containing protein n=1 Tax=Aromia moschata TaxID=1265417 RepID=A0AAV8XTG0_9CUCU|nr:hypothetical protein NQ318_005302 [Aromia moschata]